LSDFALYDNVYRSNGVGGKRLLYSERRNNISAQTKSCKKAKINDIYYFFKQYTYQNATIILQIANKCLFLHYTKAAKSKKKYG